MQLKIVLAQVSQSVGDLSGNATGMRDIRGLHPDADLIMFPELQLIGYPPEDLVLKPALIERARDELDSLALVTGDGGPAMLVGTVMQVDGALYNAVALLDDGKVAAVRTKCELPNYGTFDEKRLFEAGPLPEPIEFRGVRIGVPICEDIWFSGVTDHLKAAGAELLLVPNGSPYEIDKDDLRFDAGQCIRGSITRSGGGKYPVAHPGPDLDGDQQQVRVNAADHRKQVGNVGGLCDNLRRYGGWIFGVEGCL
jgi:NAD+ synthase